MEKEKDVWSFKTSDLVTIPNIITYVRFVLIIPFVYFFLAEQYIYAAICIGLSGLSDCFDGMAARKLNQVTPLGKILDPIADKVTLFAVVICMVIYVPMVLPIMKPTFISVAILETMWIWNDYLLPYLILDMDYKTIPIHIQYLNGSYGHTDTSAIMALIVLSIVPIIIFYFACQKYIIEGVVSGAVKG